MTDEQQWIDVIQKTVNHFGGVHILVQSAGIGLSKTVEDIELEEWRKVHAIDLDGVFLGCKHIIQPMAKSGGGSIINISSIAGIIAGHNMGGIQFGQSWCSPSFEVGGAALRQEALQHSLQHSASNLYRYADPRQIQNPLRRRRSTGETWPTSAIWPGRSTP